MFHTLLLDLTGRKDHINSPSTCAESASALNEMTLLQMFEETIEEYAGEDLTNNGEK